MFTRPIMWSIMITLFFSTAAQAGLLFLPGTLDDDRFSATKKQPDTPATHVLYADIDAEIHGDQAIAVIEERTHSTVKGNLVGVMPLPAGIKADGVQISIDGTLLKGRFVSADKAAQLYASLGVSELLIYADQPVLVIPKIQLPKRFLVRIELSYPVRSESGMLKLELPMPSVAGPKARVRRLAADIRIFNELPVHAAFSPTHEIQIERPSERAIHVRLRQDDVGGNDALQLFYVADEDPLGLRVLTHRAEGDSQGYFMVLGNPIGSGETLPKDVVVMLDSSGSMRGEKMEQARSAVTYVLDHLNPNDRFNVISFGTKVASFQDSVVPRTDDSVARAKRFIEQVSALGRTNLEGALRAGLAGKVSADRPRIVILLTDGAPTVGQMDPEKILASLSATNRSDSKVFVLGVGDDVNTLLLDQLARRTQGDVQYLREDEDIDVTVASLYDSLSHPVLNGAEITFGGLQTSAILPAQMPALFRGREIMVLGTWTGGGTYPVTVAGTLRGQRREYPTAVHFSKKIQPKNDFIASLWAARRIGALLTQIRVESQDKKTALIKEVVTLSLRFGVLTEYTAFLSESDTVYTEAEASAEATKRLERGSMNGSGKWAVNQSMNVRSLRTRKTQSVDNNEYFDRAGKTRKTSTVRQIGRNAFYKKAGKWVQSASGKAPSKKRRVKRFSPEYLDMVKKSKDFARAQQLDGDVIINMGDEQVEVY